MLEQSARKSSDPYDPWDKGPMDEFHDQTARYLEKRKHSNAIKFSSNKNIVESFKVLNFFMKIAGLKLRTKPNLDGEINQLECIAPIETILPSKGNIVFHLCVYILSTYGSVKLLFLTIFNFLRDHEFTKWRLQNYNSSNDTCSELLLLGNQLSSSTKFDDFKHISLTNVMKLSGAIATTASGGPSAAHATLGSGLFFSFNLSVMLVYFNRYRVDVLHFIRNPIGEATRIDEEIVAIISSIMDDFESGANQNLRSHSASTITTTTSFSSSSSSSTRGHEGGRSFFEFSNKIRPELNTLRLSNGSLRIDMIKTNSGSNSDDNESRHFVLPKRGNFHYLLFYKEIFSDIMEFSLVKPIIFNEKWHAWLANYSRKFLYLTCITIYLYCCMNCFSLYYVEIESRITQRLNLLKCFTGNNSNTSFKQEQLTEGYFNQIEPLDAIDVVHFLDFNNGKTNDYIELFLIESKYYLTMRMIINWSEFLIFCLLQTCYVTLYFCLHSISHLDRIAWINQIIEQIKQCIRSTIKVTNSYQVMKDDDKRQLIRELCVTYVNHELFIRQQKSFKKLSSFLVYQAGPCLIVMPLTYLIAYNIRTESVFMMMSTSTFIVAYLNFYLLHTAILTNKIEKLRKNILNLLAYSLECPCLQENSRILDYWRDHLVTQVEYRELYSTKFFGFYLTYARLFVLDLYFVVVIGLVTVFVA